MKFFGVRLAIGIAFFFLVTNCSSVKKTTNVTKKESIAKPEIVQEDSYVVHPKNERKNFFKDSEAETKWVDSIYNQLSFEERIGQLFMIAAYSNKDSTHIKDVERLVSDYKVGGLIFFQGGPMRQARLTNYYQSKSKVPLFIGIDAEWGLSMRLDSTYRYPFNMTLGAVQNLKLIEKVGTQMAKESKRMGIHFNFAPVLDINTNPKNPIIGFRSFGENKHNVTDRAIALMNGVQSEGVFSTGKHFPGHGDTSTDSHHTLPVVTATKEHLDKVELYPYKRMIDEGLVSVMVAHLNVPSIEFREGYPSSLSTNVVTNLLKNELGFEGLIFTDALNMKAASNFKKPGDIDLEAFMAGNDVLLFAENVPSAVEKICMAYQDSIFTDERLAYSVKKILRYKYKAGLHKYKPVDLRMLGMELNAVEKDALQYELYENAVTLLKNEGEILPIKNLQDKIAYVKLGDDVNSTFVQTLKKYTEITEFGTTEKDSLLQLLAPFDKVIIGFHKSDRAWKKHDFTEGELALLLEIARQKTVILDVFTRPYSLLQIHNFTDIEAVVVSYQNNDIAQEVSGQIIFGALPAKGRIPVSIGEFFKVNDGLPTIPLNRLGFAKPENVGMSSLKLNTIETIAKKAIEGKMTPGMQILVARKGKVIYQKSFGYHTYDQLTKVQNSDLYDVASLTKIMATLPHLIMAYGQQRVGLETRLGEMMPVFKGTNKDSITLKRLLTHSAGLQAWIPFYKATLDAQGQPSEQFYRKTLSEGFSKQVSENLFIKNDYSDVIFNQIIASPVAPKNEYKYSDFTFIILKRYLEQLYGKPLDVITEEQFYSSMGMTATLFNPLRVFDCDRIVPTEVDTYFRHSFLQGYVHDMEAAMEGGVAGHAGLFSNAMDMAKMMQLYLNKGHYGGQTYFSSEAFDAFNTRYFENEGNRRGLGFDKPQLGTEGPTCGCVSSQSFGHTGFTGTIAWADPKTEMIYIFLSNRTYPDSNAANMLSKQSIREDIQKIIEEAIIE